MRPHLLSIALLLPLAASAVEKQTDIQPKKVAEADRVCNWRYK